MSLLLSPLPIDAYLAQMTQSLRQNNALIIRAEPGAGKTTRVPPALLPEVPGKILVIEPRRLAARLTAERIAAERGEAVGATIGYQMRFAKATSDKTRILFITEGLFSRLVLEDPSLAGISAIVIDEFHERHIQTDMALAIARSLMQSRRPDLKLVVMSATLDTKALEQYLNAPVLDVPGRTYPIEESYHEGLGAAPAIRQMLSDPHLAGDILVFLTGLGEIHQVMKELGQLPGAQVLPLSAEVPPREQERIFRSGGPRKVILATNVAETSITLPGVTGVIDTGRAKIPSLAPWSGLTSIDIKRIPQSSCIQRAGRAGRIAPGICYRLFSKEDFLTRAPYLQPEIQRLDLTATLLDMEVLRAKLGLDRPLTFLDPPAPSLVQAGQNTLQVITAFDKHNGITPLGETLSQLPLHPRLAAVIYEAKKRNLLSSGIWMAALISEEGIVRPHLRAVDSGYCDLRYQMELLWERDHLTPPQERLFDPSRAKKVTRLAQYIAARMGLNNLPPIAPKTLSEEDFWHCLLAGFNDRVAVARAPKAAKGRKPPRTYNLCLGRGGVLAESSIVQKADFILALVASESQDRRSAATGTQIRMAAGIPPKALFAFPSPIKQEESQLSWDRKRQEVRRNAMISYGQIRIGESPEELRPQDRQRAGEILLEELRSQWPQPYADAEALEVYHAKRQLLNQQNIHHGLPEFEGEMLELLQEALSAGKSSFSELLASGSLQELLLGQLSFEQSELLRGHTPDQYQLPQGRRLKIHYSAEKPPWIASKLQDFLGIKDHPQICQGLPLVIHLLAPNHRAVQITSDLPRFWQGSYKTVRSEMMRRYPKHPWPENPMDAKLKRKE